jgi:hypothetical protein
MGEDEQYGYFKQTDSSREELEIKAITGVAVASDNTFGLNPAQC